MITNRDVAKLISDTLQRTKDELRAITDLCAKSAHLTSSLRITKKWPGFSITSMKTFWGGYTRHIPTSHLMIGRKSG
jgi:hypothetical protein